MNTNVKKTKILKKQKRRKNKKHRKNKIFQNCRKNKIVEKTRRKNKHKIKIIIRYLCFDQNKLSQKFQFEKLNFAQ